MNKGIAMQYIKIALLCSLIVFLNACKKDRGVDFDDEDVDNSLKSEIHNTKSKYWINNPGPHEGKYAIDGGGWRDLPPYALIPLDVYRGDHEIDVKLGGDDYHYEVDFGSDFTIINPAGIDTFQAVGQDYTTNQLTYFGSGKKYKTLKGEVIQRQIDYNFEQPFPKEIRMRIGTTKTMWKIYKLFPKVIPEGLAVRAIKYHDKTFKGGNGPALKALARGTGKDSWS